MDIYAPRRDRLLEQLKSESLDAYLITNPLNVTYLTGFSGEASYLVVTPKKILLVSDGRFTEQLRDECPGLETVIRPPSQTITAATAAVIDKLALSTIGVESGHLTVDALQNLMDQAKTVSWMPGSDRVEQSAAGEGCRGDRPDPLGHSHGREGVHDVPGHASAGGYREGPGRCHGDVCPSGRRQMHGFCDDRRRGRTGRCPMPRRPTGAWATRCSCWSTGANGPFYKSDLTRVLLPHNNLALPGTQTQAGKLREVFEVVHRAQAAGIAALRPGAKGGEVDAAARKVIADAGYGDYFTHSIGHGFGLQIHEAPMMRPGSELVLKAGMVVTVEPGIYLPNWGGIRIEDDILITEDGPEVLTSVPRDFAASGIVF